MIKNDSVIPLYQQIVDDIKHKIETSEYVAGQMIPSETKLCELYQVSRITIRNAISKLVDEEILVKRHGKGTFVQSEKIPSELSTHCSGFTTTWLQRNITFYTRMLTARKQTAAPKIADKLGIPENSDIVYLKRVRYAKGHAVILEHVYLPYDKFSFLLDIDLENKSLYATMEEQIGFNPEKHCYAHTIMEVNEPNSEEASLLELNDRNAVIIMGESVINSATGEVVHYTKQIYAACYFRFSITNHTDKFTVNLNQ